jgi:hypothetical protein
MKVRFFDSPFATTLNLAMIASGASRSVDDVESPRLSASRGGPGSVHSHAASRTIERSSRGCS